MQTSNQYNCEFFIGLGSGLSWLAWGLNKDVVFIDGEFDIGDMYLMSRMKNNIIANSTFSWWGAFLNKNENKKIIAPKKWFGPTSTLSDRDIIPDYWERM